MKAILSGLFVFACASQAFAQFDTTGVIAVVNGKEINGAEYYRRMEHLPKVGKFIGTSFAEFPPGFLTIEQLITEALITQLAKNRGVSPTDLEVTNEFKFRLEDDPNELKSWLASGRTEQEYRDSIRMELSQFKLRTFGITITDLQVEQFYKQNPTLFTNPRKFKLRLLAVNKAEDRAIADEKLKTRSFADVAKEMSVDISKANGGDYGTTELSGFSPAVQDALGKARSGTTTPWLQASAEVWAKFFVESIVPQSVDPLTPALRRQVRKRMMVDRGGVRNNLSKDMAEMRAKAVVDIKRPEFAVIYKQFIQSYLSEKKIDLSAKPGGG